MLLYPLKKIETQKYYQNDAQLSSQNNPEFNGVYSTNNFPKINDGTYVINLDHCEWIG